jgi:hypothetical protein
MGRGARPARRRTSQIHRFLNFALGGYVRSVNTYSSGAASVVVPPVVGNYEDLTRRNVTWEQIEQQTDIVVAFAGLAAVRLTDGIRPGVIQLPTGAWYDPEDSDEDALLCVHGNPNVLTRDVGTSALAQGCTGQLTTVQVELFKGNLPPIKAYDPP